MLEQRIKSFGYAIQGLRVFFSTQIHARIHLMAAIVTSSAGLFLGLTAHEWCIILLTFMAVLCAEAMNTAIEFLTDLASPEYHPLAGKAKDVAAGAVLLTAIGAVFIGGIIFLPKFLSLL